MDAWKADFQNWCVQTFVEEKSTHSAVTNEFVTRVLTYIRTPEIERDAYLTNSGFTDTQRAKFKYKVKEKQYAWMINPTVTGSGEPVLTLPAKDGSKVKIVVPIEKFFDTLRAIHENTGHAKLQVMMREVKDKYELLPRRAIEQFLKGCNICQSSRPRVNHSEKKKKPSTPNRRPLAERDHASYTPAQVGFAQAKKKPRTQLEYHYDQSYNSANDSDSDSETELLKHVAMTSEGVMLKIRQGLPIGKKGGKAKISTSTPRGGKTKMSSPRAVIPAQALKAKNGVFTHKGKTYEIVEQKKRIKKRKTHPSVRIKGTENNYNPVQCFDTNCRDPTPHMHCPFCVKTDCYTDPVILKAHYRVKHVDKGIDFAGLKILRCCDRCDIVGVIKGEKKFKGAHWHCYKCKNGFNRRDEAIKHYKTHFRNPQTTFQIQIAQEVNQSVTQGFETDEASASLHTEEYSVQSIHPALTEAITCMASAEDQTFSQTNFPSAVVTKLDGSVSMPGVGAIETVGVTDTQTIMIIQDETHQLPDSCVTQDITSETAYGDMVSSPKTNQDQTIRSLCETIHRMQQESNEKNKEIETLKKKVEEQEGIITQLREREQELLTQLKPTGDKRIQDLCGQLEAQHKELLLEQLSQLKKSYFQSQPLHPKILIVNNSLNSQLDQQMGLDGCTINTDSAGSISLDFDNPNATNNSSVQNVNPSNEQGIDIENNALGNNALGNNELGSNNLENNGTTIVMGEKCGEKQFEMLEQGFTETLEGERLRVEDGSGVQVETDGNGPPVKKLRGK